MNCKITARVIAALKPKEKPFQIHDTACRGFIVRVQPTGGASYYFMYRLKSGERRKMLIGKLADFTLSDAREKAEEYRNAVARGGDPGAPKEAETPTEVVTLRGYIDRVYAPWCRKHKRSHPSILNRLKSGFAPMLDLPLASLTPAIFREHRTARLSAPLGKRKNLPSVATVNRDFAHMRPVLQMAVVDGLLPSNPLALVKKEKEDANRAIRAMTDAEESAIMAVLEKRRHDYLLPMFTLSVETGIRRGEAFTLTWADVDLSARTLTIRGEKAKSYQSRVIPMTGRAVAVLSDWRALGEGEGLVFPSRIGGGQLCNIDGSWRALCTDAGVSGLRWHDLRHTFCSRAARAGVPMPVLKALAGHSAIVTTMRYIHTEADDMAAAIALLEVGR